MHLSIWKSVILSWANALELVPTTSNFIGDLSPQFFIKLCSYLKGSDVSTLQDAVAFISDYYKSLILGDEGDENYETLLATGYLLLTSVHHPNDELCKRLCRVTNREQVQIKSALEAFMDIQPSKITKELLFKTLSQLPDEPESCGNSPYLGSSSSGSPKTGTPGTDEDTPHRRRRSSRFKKVKHQLRMTMTLKNSLQDELDYAREIISNLESSVSVKNQEISKLKEQNQLLLNQRDPEVSWSSSGCKTPVNNKYDCMKCISLERQICSFEEDALQDKSEIQRLNEALETFSKKISRIESEKRNLDIQLLSYEEQIVQNKNEMSDLQTHLTDLMTNKKELESIIEELKEARSAINCSIEEDIPNNLGYEIIDLQFSELKLSLEEKDRIICEKDENITALNEKLEKLELENKQFKQEAVDYQTSIFKLKEEITKYSNIICNRESEILKLTSSNDLLNSELQEVVLKKNVFEDGLRKSEEKLEELHNLIFDLKKQHECEKASLDAEIEDCKKIVNERDLMISSFQSTLKLEAIKQNELENRCLELETTISTKEEIIGSMKQQVQHVNESLVQEVELNTGLKEQCNNLQSTLVKKNAEISVLENKISQSQSLIQEKQKENELYQLNIHELDSSVKKLTNDYELVASQLMEVMKEKENIEHQYLESQSRIAAMTDELENRKIELQKLETTCKEREKVLLLKEETISSLEEEIIRFMEDVQQENEKNATLLQEIQSFKFEVSKLLTESDKKQKELEQCDLIRQEVENENLKFKGIIDELEGKVLELLDSNQQVNSKLRCTSEEKENVEKSLKKTEESVVELNEMVDNLKKQLHQNQILLEAALRDNEKIITERDQIISTLKSSLEAENGKLEDCEKRCLDLEKTIAYNKEIIGLLEQDVKNTKDSLQQELAVCANLKKDYELSQSILAEKNVEISALESNVLKKQALIEEIEQKYEKTIAHNEEIIGLLEQDVKNTKDSLQQELAASANLKKDYELSQSILAEINAEISALESNVLQKQALIEDIKQNYEKTIAHNKETIGLLEQDVKNAKDERKQVNDDIRNQLQKSEQQIGTLSLDLGTKMKDLQTMKILCDEQENVLLLKNEKLSSLEGEVVRLTEAIALVSEKNETLTQSIQTNQLELNRLETALDNYRKEIEYSDSTKQEMELEILKFKETVNTLEAEILKLTQSKEVADAKSIEILEQKKYLEERITILEKEVKEKVSNEEKLEQDMKALQAEFNKQLARALKMEEDKLCLENYKLSVEEEKSHMQSVIRSLQGEVERLTNEHDSVTLLASNLKCETESLNRRLNNCSMDLDIKNETILMMETTISSLNSKISHLEATIKEKDNFISDAKVDLNNTKKALEKLREESRKTLDRYVDELTFVIQQKDVELSELREENESNCERIAKMAEELVHVAQTFNIEKTSLVDHAKHLEEIIELSSSTEEQLQNKIESLSKQLGSKELRVTQLEEKLQLTVELHTCEKRELTTKNKFLQTQLDDNKSKYDRLVKDLEGSNWEHFKERNSVLETENLELKNKLELKNQDIQWYKHELEIVQKSAQNTVNVNAKLEEEVKSLTRSKKQEVTRLEKEIAMLTEKLERREPNVSDISTKLREEYEEKLERLKQKMSKIYTEKMGRMMKYQTGEEKMFADQALEREKQKRISLESKVRQLSDQLLILQEEKRALISNKIFRTPVYPFGGPISNPAYESPPLQKTHSLDRLPTTSHGLDNLGADCLDQSFSSRRTSTSSNRSNHVPKGIGKVFPAADEDGEVFDNRCLADLKEGICTLAPGPGGDDRLSILQQRNSMCPPHLKSSYPVESQFFAPNAKEDEIKVIARENKENQPQDSRYAVPGTPSKLRSLFSSMKHKHHHKH